MSIFSSRSAHFSRLSVNLRLFLLFSLSAAYSCAFQYRYEHFLQCTRVRGVFPWEVGMCISLVGSHSLSRKRATIFLHYAALIQDRQQESKKEGFVRKIVLNGSEEWNMSVRLCGLSSDGRLFVVLGFQHLLAAHCANSCITMWILESNQSINQSKDTSSDTPYWVTPVFQGNNFLPIL